VNWADLANRTAGQSCVSNGNLTGSTGNAADLLSAYVNGQSAYVLVTACYRWDDARNLPFWNIGNFANGAMLIQSSIAFQTEPYS